MTIAELRALPAIDQLATLLSCSKNPEWTLASLAFESAIRRNLLRNPPAVVEVLPFQQPVERHLDSEVSKSFRRRELWVDLDPKLVDFIASDPDFFAAAVMPRALSSQPPHLTWAVSFRGTLWSLGARFQVPDDHFSVPRESVDQAEESGMRYVFLTNDAESRLVGCVVSEALRARAEGATYTSVVSEALRRPQPWFLLPADSMTRLGKATWLDSNWADVWMDLVKLMSRS